MWVEPSLWFPNRLALVKAGEFELGGLGVTVADNIDPELRSALQVYVGLFGSKENVGQAEFFEGAMLRAALTHPSVRDHIQGQGQPSIPVSLIRLYQSHRLFGLSEKDAPAPYRLVPTGLLSRLGYMASTRLVPLFRVLCHVREGHENWLEGSDELDK